LSFKVCHSKSSAAVKLVMLGALACAWIASAAAQDFPSEEQLRVQAANLPPAVRQQRVVKPGPQAANPKQAAPAAAVTLPSLPSAKNTGPIALLGATVAPGTSARLVWRSAAMGFTETGAPVVVINGRLPGPSLCLTGGVHGDELNGVEVVNRVLRKLDAKTLAGSVIAVPVVNIGGFQRNSRYLPDRRDLNRYFPGSPGGSAASRLAHSFFHSVILGCDYLVDFHTGSFERANLPQVRGNLRIREVLEFTRNFGATTVLHSVGARGMLRAAATDAGIPAVTFEIGGPVRLEQKEIEFGVRAIDTLMSKLNMTARLRVWSAPQPVLYRARWLRTNQSGLLISKVALGDKVRAGQTLGTVRDPLTGAESGVIATLPGKVIGLALNQQVMPGYAVYHLGVESSEAEVMLSALKPRLLSRGGAESVDASAELGQEDEEDAVDN
jgi:uncharacterized protein